MFIGQYPQFLRYWFGDTASAGWGNAFKVALYWTLATPGVLANFFCHGFDSLHGHRNVRMGSEGCKLGVLPGSFAFWWRPGAFAVHPTRIPAPEADSPVFGESWIYRSWWQSG